MRGLLLAATLHAVLLHTPGVALHTARYSLRLRGGESPVSPPETPSEVSPARATRSSEGLPKTPNLKGGSGAASSQLDSLKGLASRRAEIAKSAGKAEGFSLTKSTYRIFFSLTNKLGLTGSSTRVVNGRVILSRNPVQALLHYIYVFFRAIYLFFKTLFVPLSTLDAPKKFGGSGGGGRATFKDLSKKKQMRMADLPPMPGG